jgi:hypothetical protein
MNFVFASLLNRDKSKTIRSLIFFAALFLYLWLLVQPNLIYHGGGQITNFPIFYTDLSFFNDTVWHPGGLIEYLSDFLSQFLIFSWAGSIILTLHAFLFCLFTGYFLKRSGIALYSILSFIPAILLFLTYSSYTYHFTATLALLAALIFSALFIKYQTDKLIQSLSLFLLLFILLYLIAAGLSFYFALLCVLYEVFIKRRFLSGLLDCAIALLSGLILTQFIFNLSLDNLYYSKLFTFSTKITLYPDRRLIGATFALYILLPLLVIVFGIWRLLFEKSFLALVNKIKVKFNPHKANKEHKKTIFARMKLAFVQSQFFLGLNLLLPFLVAVPSIWRLSDTSQKPFYQLCYYVRDKNWSKVIEISYRKQDVYYFNHAFNLALYHKGLLLSDMFSRQQDPSSLFFTGKNDLLLMEQQAGIFYDLGCVNESEQLLVELFEAYGPRPEILKKLALLKLAKNDTNTARVYLGALSKSLFYSGWAKNYLKKLDDDPVLSNDAEVQRLRSLMPQKDNISYEYPIEDRLTDLLQKNKTNKMAFEYLMAFYFFSPDLEQFVINLPRLDDFNYQQIPRHYEEAILTYVYFTKKAPDLKKRVISTQSKQRFSSFIKMVNNPRVTLGELKTNFGDTYEFFYYTHGSTGAKR